MHREKTEFKVLKAFNGDCIFIRTFTAENEEFTILIDGGTKSTFEYSLKKEIATEKIDHINLLILTHIDSDHIGGLINLFKNSLISNIDIDEIWINHPELIDITSGELISFDQADTLKTLIKDKKPNSTIRRITTESNEIYFNKIKFTILSPSGQILESLFKNWQTLQPRINQNDTDICADNTDSLQDDNDSLQIDLQEVSNSKFKPISSIKEDLINASSIAFILECIDSSFLFLADSRAELIENELRKLDFSETNRLICDYVKVSHHGSKHNTSKELLQIIKSNNYIISTNGGSSINRHPSRETIARILFNSGRDFDQKINIFTNYSIEDIESKRGKFIKEGDSIEANWNIEQKNNF